jgi:hypothetical protein
MRALVRLLFLFVLVSTIAVIADAQWLCDYVTLDDTPNGAGQRVVGCGVIHENMFIELVTAPGIRNFMIPYVNADSVNGRKYTYGYGSTITAGIYQTWTDGGFDQVAMLNAMAIRVRPDSLIYVASNDADHNVLVFKYTQDTITVVSPFPRQQTGTNSIFGIDVDANGYVYVCNDTTTGQTADVKIYSPIRTWTVGGHTYAPVKTIDLPDGVYKQIAVTPTGSAIFIADYKNRKVIKYTGSPATGYTLAAGFSFHLGAKDTITNSVVGGPPTNAGPIGLGYLASKNILAVACDSLLKPANSAAYSYARIYLLNGNTGAFISTDTSKAMIDQAAWNYAVQGSYAAQGPGTSSGYASLMDVKWDEKENLYTQSMYGWTGEKWTYNGTLPSFTAGVEEVASTLPEGFTLSQNYPNPFNPSTKIDFTLPASGFVSLKVYDLLGREMMTLVNEQKTAGTYRATFDASNMPSGTYFYTLKTGSFSETKKMLLVK